MGVRGIAHLADDIRALVRQELALARAELREELRQLVGVLVAAALSIMACAAAGLWLLIALTRAVAEVLRWPLGGAYAIVGAALAFAGAVCAAIAWSRGREIRLLPRTRATLHTLTNGEAR